LVLEDITAWEVVSSCKMAVKLWLWIPDQSSS